VDQAVGFVAKQRVPLAVEATREIGGVKKANLDAAVDREISQVSPDPLGAKTTLVELTRRE